MKRRTKIILWVYFVGFVLAEINWIQTGYVMGAFDRMHGTVGTAAWWAIGVGIAISWPLWAVMIILQLLGLEI